MHTNEYFSQVNSDLLWLFLSVEAELPRCRSSNSILCVKSRELHGSHEERKRDVHSVQSLSFFHK